ncbi:MAG: hypothetical protein IJI36_06790 [Kiritimatiellae bacterium]|nr:hypothetical protein [Kiritimatiellia bacterium]
MSEKPVFTIELPVQPKDVFRLLALRSITETDGLIEKLLDNFDSIFKGIEMTPRLDRDSFGRDAFGYKHKGLDVEDIGFSDMTERQLCAAKSAFYADRDFAGIGRVLDYEMPLDDKKDSAFGKVDLVSQITDELLLLEVKKCESNEHPLRAMFEIFTFWKTLSDEDGKFDVFIDAYKKSPTYNLRKGDLSVPIKVLPGLLLCGSSDIYKELMSPASSDGKRDELYRRFLESPIGLRVFRYDENNLEVVEVTNDLKNRLRAN